MIEKHSTHHPNTSPTSCTRDSCSAQYAKACGATASENVREVKDGNEETNKRRRDWKQRANKNAEISSV